MGSEFKHGVTAGILYCGDLGSAVGRSLLDRGVRVVTTCEDRSHATMERARLSGIETLPTLGEVIARSDYVFSFVLPGAAMDVAQRYADHAHIRPADSIFIEGNTISIELLKQIERLMVERNIPFVDGAVHGVAARVRDMGVLYVSGPQARSVETICQGALHVLLLSEQVGAATRVKLMMAGVSKSLAALFLEMGALAERTELLEPFLEGCAHFYPGMMSTIERILPTYPRHAGRRVSELRAIQELGHEARLRLGMAHEAEELIGRVARIDWDQEALDSPTDIRNIIRSVAEAFQS